MSNKAQRHSLTGEKSKGRDLPEGRQPKDQTAPWGQTYERLLRKSFDHGYAAFRADEAEARRKGRA